MSLSNEQVLRKAVDCFVAGDMENLAALLTDDLAVHVPGSNQLSGDYKGKDEFFTGLIGKIMGLTEGQFALEPHDVLGSTTGDHAVGVYTMKATRGDKKLEWRHVNVYHVRDEKLAEIFFTPHDYEEWNEFWS
jgi:ketosteroid isomerase-like protein